MPDSEKSDFCLPNRCFCLNGLAATSSYDTMHKICGVRKQDEAGVGSDIDEDEDLSRHLQTRINNGKQASQIDFPFQCQLFKDKKTNTSPFCSASIISPLYLLTAGHCLVDNSHTLAKVYALVESETNGQVVSKKIFVHEKYYESIQNSGFILNDIGLIYLSEAVLFNTHYRPICIHEASLDDMMEQDLIVAGYGGKETLKQATFNVATQKDCENEHGFEAEMMTFDNGTKIENAWSNKFCAAAASSSKEIATCSGDSGAPLMIEMNELILGKLTVKYSLVGIVSAGAEKCSSEHLPTIFTEIYNYSEWIRNTINGTEYANVGKYCSVDRDQGWRVILFIKITQKCNKLVDIIH